MNRESIVVGVVGILIGFILGYFVALGLQIEPDSAITSQSAAGLPENHPSPEVMSRLQELTQRAQNDPNDQQARTALGNMYYDMQRYDAAIPWYEESLALDPSDVRVSTDLGTAYLYQGDTERAIEQYQKSLVIEPDHPQTLQNAGIAYFSIGRYREAIDVWSRLIEAHPNYPQAREIKDQIQTAQAHLDDGSS